MAPKTVKDWALATDQIGARVRVWDNELDDTRDGTLTEYHPEGWPLYIVTLDATEWEPERKVRMDQGPYTDSGRFRVVEVLTRSMEQLYGHLRGEAAGA